MHKMQIKLHTSLTEPYPLPDSQPKYMPHQGKQEMERRAKQLAKKAAKANSK